MGWKKWFGRVRDNPESDPLADFVLGAMKVGYLVDYDMETWEVTGYNTYDYSGFERRCCTARSKSLTSLCRLQSHPAQYVSGIPSAAILLSISHPIRCSTRCLANVRARISGPMIAL